MKRRGYVSFDGELKPLNVMVLYKPGDTVWVVEYFDNKWDVRKTQIKEVSVGYQAINYYAEKRCDDQQYAPNLYQYGLNFSGDIFPSEETAMERYKLIMENK